MKRIFSFAATLLFAMVAMGQEPVITFDKTTHDFGKINEADGRVTTVFTFKNEGMAPLVLSNVRAWSFPKDCHRHQQRYRTYLQTPNQRRGNP